MADLDELKTLLQQQGALLQQHMTLSDQRHTETVRHQAAFEATLKTHGSQLAELYARVGKNEEATRRALDSQTDLEGDLLREVGALAANDRKQNEEIAEIKRETVEQSATLAKLHDSEIERVTREKLILWWVTKGIPMLWGATVAVGGGVYWLVTHLH